MWLNLAAATGDENARKTRERVAARMTREQIAEAQARAREWANPDSLTPVAARRGRHGRVLHVIRGAPGTGCRRESTHSPGPPR